MTDLKKLIEETGKLVKEYKETNDARLDAIEKNGEESADAKEKLAKMDDRLSELDEIKNRLEEVETKSARPDMNDKNGHSVEQKEHKEAFVAWLRTPNDQKAMMELQEKSKAALRKKEISGSVAAEGGYAVPEIISSQIEARVLELSPMRQHALVMTVGSRDFKKLVNVRGAAGGWVGEKDARPETGTSTLEEVAPTFGTVYGYPKATEESLTDIFFDVESWLVGDTSDEMANLESDSFVKGNGTNKPTGYLASPTPVLTTDATRAFGTLQYVASGAAADITSHDPIIDLVASLKNEYKGEAKFFGNRTTKAKLRKLKDSQGQYLWEPGLKVGTPDMYQGHSFVEDEKLANPTVANAFPLAFGNMRRAYMITDLVGMRSTRDEITEPGYVKYYVRRRVGGNLFNDHALKLLKVEA